jgi:hypothetical protein
MFSQDGLTLLLFALIESKKQTAQFLVKKRANILAVDTMDRYGCFFIFQKSWWYSRMVTNAQVTRIKLIGRRLTHTYWDIVKHLNINHLLGR